jgi:hypothetical protein
MNLVSWVTCPPHDVVSDICQALGTGRSKAEVVGNFGLISCGAVAAKVTGERGAAEAAAAAVESGAAEAEPAAAAEERWEAAAGAAVAAGLVAAAAATAGWGTAAAAAARERGAAEAMAAVAGGKEAAAAAAATPCTGSHSAAVFVDDSIAELLDPEVAALPGLTRVLFSRVLA